MPFPHREGTSNVDVIIAGPVIGCISYGMEGIQASISGIVVGMVVLIPFYLLKGIGGGDVKLLGAIGSLKGVEFVLNCHLWSLVIASIAALIIVVMKRALRPTINAVFKSALSIVNPQSAFNAPASKYTTVIPYGMIISIGAVITLIRTCI